MSCSWRGLTGSVPSEPKVRCHPHTTDNPRSPRGACPVGAKGSLLFPRRQHPPAAPDGFALLRGSLRTSASDGARPSGSHGIVVLRGSQRTFRSSRAS